MKKLNCPVCGKELIRLEPFEKGVYEFWCDHCNIDISITKNDEVEEREYTVKQYFNGIHWDNSYTNSKAEAEEWKAYMEDKNSSIRNRVNWDALEQFVEDYDIADEESIEITVEIVED